MTTQTIETPIEIKMPLWKRALRMSFLASTGAFIVFHGAMTVVLASAATAAHFHVMDKLDLLHPLFGA